MFLNPKQIFSKNRKIPYEKMILALLAMERASLSNELLRQFGYGLNTAISSAFVQQHKKILPKAFASLFRYFTAATYSNDNYKGYKLLAVDGSDIQTATNLNDKDSLFQTSEGVKPYNLLHLNALYHLKSHTYEDAVIFKRKEASENKALTEMVDRSTLQGNVIVIADREYEYKVNFSVAVHICCEFLLSINIPPDIESLIARHITPIRPGRSRPREMKGKQAIKKLISRTILTSL